MAVHRKFQKSLPLLHGFKFIEIPKYPSIAPNLWLLNFTGLRIINNKSKAAVFKKCYLYTVIFFFFSQYVKSCFKFDVSTLTLLLHYAPFHIGLIKIFHFKKNLKKWENIISYIFLVEEEQLAEGDEEIGKIIREYVNRARRISFYFWALPVFVDPLVFYERLLANQYYDNDVGNGTYYKVLDIYVPHGDYPPGYYVSMSIQTIIGCSMSAYIVSWDTLVCITMIFFASQLKIIRLVCSRTANGQNNEEIRKNIAKCHQSYTSIVKHQRLFNSVVSPVMFINLIITSINFGISIREIARVKDDFGTMATGCAYVVACLIQLLIFYWHSNEVTEESLLVSYGTFESDWTRIDNKNQKALALLAITTSKRLVFEAGPFNEMTLQTFLGIIRASYSYYTLLSKTN